MMSSIDEMGLSSLTSGGLLPAGQIAGQHVDLEIYAVANLERAQSRRFPGMRDDVHAEDVVLHLVDRQRDAFDADRALRRDIAMQWPRRPDLQPMRAAFRLDRNHLA